ncbi:MAG: alpha/beta fold hydrolase [Planctomycetota bacterium]|jgi:haloalkane dehalogenase|nr:alpha/beta fold hydrolase [Planctomycetota bacterium]
MGENELTQQELTRAKPRRTIDRRHWAAKIGIAFRRIKDPQFRAMYPFDSRLHSLGEYSYHYLDEGEGEPVVMVHGNPTWSFFYRGLVRGLRETHRCLVPDHIGCGLSQKPKMKKYKYTLEQHISNLESWLEETLPPYNWRGGKINMIVHDWGGPIGIGYIDRHPERIKRFVIMNTSSFTAGDMPKSIKMCRWPVIGEYIVRRMNLFAIKATERCTVKPMPALVKKFYLMPYNSWNNRVGIDGFVKDIPLSDGPTRDLLTKIEWRLKDILRGIPTLIQWGMADWCFTPFFLDLWKNAVPDAEIDEYNAGHYLLEDMGGPILSRIREFLQRPAP